MLGATITPYTRFIKQELSIHVHTNPRRWARISEVEPQKINYRPKSANCTGLSHQQPNHGYKHTERHVTGG
jgi:hypothetical protein